MAVDPNLIALAARQVKRMTVGKTLAQKQDQAANTRAVDNVLTMRPKNIKPLNESDFRQIGKQRNVPPAVLHVISDKESGKDGGFMRDGRIVVSDEPQWFSKLTAGAYDITHPHLSYPRWVKTREPNKLPKQFLETWGKHPMNLPHAERWQLWAMQAALNFDAALSCLGVGRFQVMLLHWRRMGFESPLAMMQYAYTGEAAHLDLCVRWFQIEDKLEAVRTLNWRVIASYNGSGQLAEYAADCQKLYAKRCTQYA